MNTRPRLSRLTTLLLLALAGSLWVLFAPLQFGGWTSFVIVSGNSMQPLYQRGDLVILRQAPAYHAGDVITYRHPQVGAVIHRIIGQEDGRWVTQGDHNTWTDDYHPLSSDILGKAWLRLAGVGNAVAWLRRPLVVGALAALAGLGLLSSIWTRPLRAAGGRFIGMHTWKVSHDWIFTGLAVLACAALVLMAFAFTRPVMREAKEDIAYTQQARFDYSAKAPAGVYDAPQVRAGEPIFPQLTCQFAVAFAYQLTTAAPAELGGVYRLDAEVRASNGWAHRETLQAETPFQGAAFDTGGQVDLCHFQARVRQMQALTGIVRGGYTLAILPQVSLQGQLAGHELKEAFTPTLLFQLDDLELQLAATGPGVTDPLQPSQAGLLQVTQIQPETLLIFNHPLEVRTARILSAVGLILSLGGIAALEAFAYRRTRRGDADALRERFAGRMITLAPGAQLDNGHALEVDSLDDLARLAEGHAGVILAQQRGDCQEYRLRVGDASYAYTLPAPASGAVPAATVEDAAPLDADLRLALINDQLLVYYQPVISLTTNRITQLEALIRWQHPHRGLIQPGELIPLAEKVGLMPTLGRWVLQTACRQLKAWQIETGQLVCLMVNLTPQEVLAPGFEEFVAQTLADAALDPGCLHFELSCRAAGDWGALSAHLAALKKLGVRISIDDFSDQQALGSLDAIPADLVKIDAGALQTALTDMDRKAVAVLIRLAHELQLEVVAERVETEEQLDCLKRLDCGQAQGYWISRPSPATQVGLMLREGIPPREQPFFVGGVL